ncbi:unnamed protein product [Closterium sp. NIES-54]
MAEPAELSPGPAAKPAAGFAAGPVGEAVAAQPAETATGPKAMSVASMPPSVQHNHPHQLEEGQLREPQSRTETKRKRVSWLKSLGSLLGRKVAELLWPSLRSFSLGLLVDALGFSIGLAVSLPELDFCLSAYAGLDLMSLPGISGLLHKKIQSAIAGHMLWPRRFTLRTKAAAVTTGRTKRAVGTVTVEVVEATELTQTGLLLAQNILYPSPYVKAYIDPSRSVSTAIESYTCDPVWREVLRLPVIDQEADALTFEVHDATALLVDSLIGSCVLHISNLQPGISQHFTLGLWSNRGLPCGELELIATFRVLQSETMPRKLLSEDAVLARPGMQPRLQLHADGPGLLEVAVWRGLDLDASSWLGRNPDEAQFLCKVFLAGEERVTKVAEGRGNPQWEESFEFLLDQPPVTEKLLIEVWSRSPEAMLVGSAEKMVGSVEIPLCDALKNKRIVDIFQLHHTKQGYLKLELQWRLLAEAS